MGQFDLSSRPWVVHSLGQGYAYQPGDLPPPVSPAGGGIPDVVVAAAGTAYLDAADLLSAQFADDGAMFTEAVNLLAARNGGWIHLLEGEYSVSTETLILLSRVVKISGAGRNTTVIKVKSGANIGAVFRVGQSFASAGGITFTDLTIDGNKTFATTTDLVHFSGGSQSQVHFTRVRVRNGTGNGINIQRPGGSSLCRLTDTESVSNNGMGLIAYETEFKAVNCQFSSNGSNGVAVGFGGKRTFIGCDISSNGAKGVANDGLSGGTGECTIVGCTINGNATQGIDLNHFNAVPSIIVGNQIQGNGTEAIDAYVGSIVGLNLISGNGNDVPNPPQIGISQQQVVPWSRIGSLDITIGSHKYVLPDDAILVSVRAAVGTAPTGAAVIVDVNLNGASIFGTKPTVPDGQAIGTKVTPSTVAASEGDYITVDIDQIGSTTPGEDLTVMLELLWLTG